MKTNTPIPEADKSAMAYIGMMGHTWAMVRTFDDGSVRLVGECNSLEECQRFGKTGDRIYQRIGISKRYRWMNPPKSL